MHADGVRRPAAFCFLLALRRAAMSGCGRAAATAAGASRRRPCSAGEFAKSQATPQLPRIVGHFILCISSRYHAQSRLRANSSYQRHGKTPQPPEYGRLGVTPLVSLLWALLSTFLRIFARELHILHVCRSSTRRSLMPPIMLQTCRLRY